MSMNEAGFVGCRICLQRIHHEPIKVNRSMQDFLSERLFMINICRIKQNIMDECVLCAKCFNRLSDLQEFYDHCTQIDKYWQSIFDGVSKVETGNDGSDGEFIENNSEETSDLLAYQEIDVVTGYDMIMYQEEKSQQTSDECLVYDSLEKPKATNSDQTPKTSLEKRLLKDTTDERDATATRADEESARIVYYEQNNALVEVVDMEDMVELIMVQQRELDDLEHVNEHEDMQLEESSNNTDILELCEKSMDYEQRVQDSSAVLHAAPKSVSQISTPGEGMKRAEVKFSKGMIEDHKDTAAFLSFGNLNRKSLRYRVLSNSPRNGLSKKYYQCLTCEKQFERLSDMETHVHIHENLKPFVCHICGRGFRQKNILNTHQTAIHFGKKIECPDCGKKFSRPSQLILHNRMHRDEKPFQCDFKDCTAAFRQRQHLVDHQNIHTGTRSFYCRYCSKSFHMRRRLQDHLYKVHSSNRYRCNICSKDFLKPHMLRNHFASVHKLEVADVSHLRTTVGS